MMISRKRRNESDRPEIRPEMQPVDWLLEAIALIGFLSFIGIVLYYFPKLPDMVPSHFNEWGAPDNWENKSSVWSLLGITVFIYALLTFINFIPHRFNFPVRITPQNALRQYTLAMRLIRYLKIVLVWMFFYIDLTTIRVTSKSAAGLGTWFLPVIIVLILLPLIIYSLLVWKKN
ncbi:MAG: DUF1648 domain-containing protein [Bacteroidales bacterium]|jgi:uncharacterized membrane protein|nr:DUF1648 domain-containing protein [Bacteroidales bacterium]